MKKEIVLTHKEIIAIVKKHFNLKDELVMFARNSQGEPTLSIITMDHLPRFEYGN